MAAKERQGVRAIFSWNIWLMPLVSPNCLSRSLWLGQELDFAIRRIDADLESDGLVIFCVQEAWAFQTGLLMWPLLWLASTFEHSCCRRRTAQPIKSARGSISEALASSNILILILIILCIPLRILLPWVTWDPKRDLIKRSRHLDHCVGIGASQRLHPKTLLDSGLAILTNCRSVAHGFMRYCDCDGETAANKGVLWAYYLTGQNEQTTGTLVLNTHVNTSSRCSLKQIDMALNLIEELKLRYEASTPWFEVWFAGDFNMSHEGPLETRMNEAGLFRVAIPGPTDWARSRPIDHFFHSHKKLSVQAPEAYYHPSVDHGLISVRVTGSIPSLDD